MALEGSIRDFGLAEIFQLILLQKKEGILTLTDGKGQVSVQFREGEIIQAEHKETPTDEALGNAFLNAGKITVEQLKEGLRRRNNKTLGQGLIEFGYLSQDQVRTLNRTLTEEIIFRLFEWKMGNYKFEQKNISFDPELVTPLKTESILMEGMQRLDEWPALLKKIPSKEIVFEVASADGSPESASVDPVEPSKKDSFESMGNVTGGGEKSEPENPLYSSIDGERTLQDLIDKTQMGAFPVYKELSSLLSNGKIKIKKGTAQSKSQFISVKKLTSIQTSLRTLLIGITICMTTVVWVFSYSSMKSTVLSALDSTREFKKLQVWNERDILLNALELYRLERQVYPGALQNLIEERFLASPKERSIDLGKWIYEVEEGKASLLPRQ